MLIILILWVAIVVALIVYVLVHARRESHRTDFFYNMDQDPESQRRKPRAVSTNIAFTPSQSSRRRPAPDEAGHSTSETPVYVNDPSVVEVRGLGRGIDIPDVADASGQGTQVRHDGSAGQNGSVGRNEVGFGPADGGDHPSELDR